MIALAPYLAAQQLREAIAAARAFKDESLRSKTLAALLLYIPGDQFREAVAAAKAVREADVRVGALAVLVKRVPETVKGDVLLAVIDAAGSASRGRTGSAVEAAACPTFELGGQAAILELYRSITDVGRWYP
jgi:hypothetical protein